ncbi:MAG: leucine-rich repeat domain-containing protein [Thermoguttaceae bacterium]|nr:leucine-rich repeat domain-containing protein [Thermoguttaceae bacterium]
MRAQTNTGRRVWVVLGMVVLLAGCRGCGGTSSDSSDSGSKVVTEGEPRPPSAESPSGRSDSAQPLPPEIVQAWTQAGAQVGWMARVGGGSLAFKPTKEKLLEDVPDFIKREVEILPAFRFEYWQAGLIRKLPAPPAPFGLALSGSGILDEGLEELVGFQRLQVLDLESTRITDAGLEHLAGLKNLQVLDLSFTRITDAGLEHLTGMKNLQGLNLRNTRITDAGLEHLAGMKNLQVLELDNTRITDAGLEHLAGMKNLQGLNLWNTRITDAGLEMLQKALPNCKIIYVPPLREETPEKVEEKPELPEPAP